MYYLKIVKKRYYLKKKPRLAKIKFQTKNNLNKNIIYIYQKYKKHYDKIIK